MEVLILLCQHSGEVLSTSALLNACWKGADVSDNVVHKIVTKLRRALDDSSTQPQFIETVRKRGYRTIMAVTPLPPPVLPGEWRDRSPFRGLDAFEEADAPIFFGRTEAIHKLEHAVHAQVRSGRSLVLVLGPSGSGKTSLVRAGLLPALMKGAAPGANAALLVSATVFDLSDIGEHSVYTALGSALLDLEYAGAPVFAGETGYSLGLQLQQDCAGLLAKLARTDEAGAQLRWGLFVDRFEAVFGAAPLPGPQLDAFLEVLDTLACSGRLVLIVACRNDFYQHLAKCTSLMAGKNHGAHFDVMPPSPAEIAQIIRLPAQAAGLSFGVDAANQTRLDDVLCADAAGQPDALPLLQHTLQELYRLRGPDGDLGFDAYRRLGGVEGAIGQRAQEILDGLPLDQRAALPHILSLLVCLPGNDEAVVSRRAAASALTDDAARALMRALVDARLFKSELIDGAASFGLAHDALLRRWPLVTTWIEEHRNALRVQSRIRQLAGRWIEAGRASDLLLPGGVQLNEAKALLERGALHLSADETALIMISRRRARYSERVRIATLGLILLLALMAAGAALSAVFAKRVAQQRRADAEGLMGFMLGDFVEKLRPMGRLDLLDSVSAKSLDYLAASAGDELTPDSMTHRASALQLIAEVHVARGNPAAALSALEAAQRLLAVQLKQQPDSWKVLKSLGANAFWSGQIYFHQGEWTRTEAAYRQYQHYSDRMFDIEPDNVDSWIEQSYAHTNLGSLALKRGRPREAEAAFVKSIALKTAALTRRAEDKALKAELANSLSWLGSTKETLGKLRDAQDSFGRELQIVSDMHNAAPTESLWASRMASALQRRSRVSIALGESAQAIDDIERAELALLPVIAREPTHRVWRASLATIQLDKLRASDAQLASAAVLARLEAVAGQVSALLQFDSKKADWLRLQAMTDLSAGLALMKAGRLAQAAAAVDKSLQRLKVLRQLNQADVQTIGGLGRTLLAKSAIAFTAGRPDAARAACQQAKALLAAQATDSADYRILDPWTRAQLCLGEPALGIASIQRLAQMGYRDKTYLAYLLHPPMRKFND